MTRFGSVSPAAGLRFDDPAGLVGQRSPLVGAVTARNVDADGMTAVKSKTAAAAVVLLGIPTPVPPGGNPATGTLRQAPPASVPVMQFVVVGVARVLQTRTGERGWKVPAPLPGGVVK